MSEVMHRHWKTLQLVPRHPRKKSAKRIWQELDAQGYATSERTVQRDLKELSGAFPLTCDETNKPYGWQWAKNADLINIPAMDLSTALTFRFVREYVDPLLPASVRSDLAAHFDAAEKTLNTYQDAKLPSWAEKIVVIPQGQPLEAPEIADGVAETVSEALLADRQLRVVYRKRGAGGDEPPQERLVHPLGLVLRNQVYYLVATLFDYDNEVQLALHRIDAAELLDEPAKRKPGFRLKDYVARGNFAYPVGDRIKLEVRMDRAVAFHLGESPLAADQAIESIDDDTVRVSATVPDTQQLRWWLLGFGDSVTVEAPAALRDEFARIATNLHAAYAGAAPSRRG